MAFLDNSGDIILDAVLTDTGRKRLAKGDGSFRITKFAFGDDEINYNLYDYNHASGSAYFDLNILQSPVFEAFTNNTSVIKSKLLTIARTDLLYLPVVKLNFQAGPGGATTDPTAVQLANTTNSGSYVISTNSATSDIFTSGSNQAPGFTVGNNMAQARPIVFDQGIDNNALGLAPLGVANTLTETAYVVEIDNRLGVIVNPDTNEDHRVSFVDDDQIASYYMSVQGNLQQSTFFDRIPQNVENGTATSNGISPIAGRPGLSFSFKVRSTDNLAGSNYLFDTLGASDMVLSLGATKPQGSFRYVDSTIRVTGFTTGYRVDIPVRFIKLI